MKEILDKFFKKKKQEEEIQEGQEGQEENQEGQEERDNQDKKKKLIGIGIAVLVGSGYLAYNFLLKKDQTPPPSPVINTSPVSPIEDTGSMVNIPPPVAQTQNQVNQPSQKPQDKQENKETKQETKQEEKQEMKPEKRQVPQVSPLPSQEKPQPQESRRDVFNGKEIGLSDLERQKEVLELQAQIKQLEVEIAEKESKMKELKGQPIKPKETEVLKQEIDMLKMQLSKKEQESRQFAGSGSPQELAYSVKAVICDTGCRAVVSTPSGEFTVIKGSRLIDGTTVIDVKNDGVVFNKFGQTFYKPVELFIPPQESQNQGQTVKRNQNPQPQTQTIQPRPQPFIPYQMPIGE